MPASGTPSARCSERMGSALPLPRKSGPPSPTSDARAAADAGKLERMGSALPLPRKSGTPSPTSDARAAADAGKLEREGGGTNLSPALDAHAERGAPPSLSPASGTPSPVRRRPPGLRNTRKKKSRKFRLIDTTKMRTTPEIPWA